MADFRRPVLYTEHVIGEHTANLYLGAPLILDAPAKLMRLITYTPNQPLKTTATAFTYLAICLA